MSKKILALIAILSAAAGIFGFSQSRYEATTLVLLVKTYEKGERRIYVTDGATRKVKELVYVLGDSEGADSFYALELPRVRLESIRIPPLAKPGSYQLDGITLSGSLITYSWDNDMVCTEQASEGTAGKKPCSSDSPVITMGADSSIAISSIPAGTFANSSGKRAAVALVAALVVFFSGVFLLGSASRVPFLSAEMPYPLRAAWLALILLYGHQLFLIATYAVDIPYYEEWEFFDGTALGSGLSWHWLTSQLCHQRMMVFTKLAAWVNYKLFSLDFVKLKIMNYAAFGGILLGVASFNRKIRGGGLPYIPCFMIFLLSPIVYEVHVASFQSGETAVVLFSVLMLNCLFGVDSSLKSTLIFCACALGALSSLSAGLVYTIVFLVCGTLYFMIEDTGQKKSPAGRRNILLVWSVLVTCIVFWFLDFKKPGPSWGLPEWLLPIELKFWSSYLTLLGYSFGFELESLLPGMICLVVVLAPLVILLLDREKRRDAASWQVATAIMGARAVIGLLVVGRGNMPYGIKVSRYVIFGNLLIPFTAMAWWLALKSGRQRAVALTMLWCFCAAAYWNNWDFRVYRDVRQLELVNLECVAEYSRTGGDGMCPGTYLFPIGRFYDSARELDVHFTRQFNATPDRAR
jgi:hypothetical protein